MIRDREVSPVEVLTASVARIERLQPRLCGFITEMFEQAHEVASEREIAIAKNEYLGPLDGIPVGVKDNLAVAGVAATVGAKANADFIPEADAEAVRRLRAAGAIVIGKENMHEFAAGGRSNNPYYGAVKNPWDADRIPGGSSGGGGANVAACLTFASLGTDVGGSVRFPSLLWRSWNESDLWQGKSAWFPADMGAWRPCRSTKQERCRFRADVAGLFRS